MEKLQLPPCKPLRKTLNDFVDSFNDCDLRGAVSSNQPPNMMVWSALSYAQQELRKCRVFDNSAPHGYGGGLPNMGEDQWDDVDAKVEEYLWNRVCDASRSAYPQQPWGNNELSQRLSALRFVPLAALGIECADNGDSDELSAAWARAQSLLNDIVAGRSPRQQLAPVKEACRIIGAAVEAVVNTGKGLDEKRAEVGADEVLPAITWVVIQANPPGLAGTLWHLEHYTNQQVPFWPFDMPANHPPPYPPHLICLPPAPASFPHPPRQSDLMRGEDGFCLANLLAAVQFANNLDPGQLSW